MKQGSALLSFAQFCGGHFMMRLGPNNSTQNTGTLKLRQAKWWMLGDCTYTIYNLTRHDYPSVIGEELAYYIIIIVIIIIIINITVTYKLIFLSFQVSIPYKLQCTTNKRDTKVRPNYYQSLLLSYQWLYLHLPTHKNSVTLEWRTSVTLSLADVTITINH